VGIAFFDLDRTLLAANSGTLWIRQELRLGHISRWQALRAASWLARYHLGFAGLEDAVLRAIASLAGSSMEDVRARTAAFYQAQVKALYRSGAREALDRHRRRGDRLVLLTSSSKYMAELVAKDLQLDGVLCNDLEVDATGCHTGRVVSELCFGKGKLAHARTYASSHGVALSDCAFYTDSYSDLPVLEVVGRPVAVNPDRRLRKEASRRGWDVVDWGGPAG
jgi:HAD superfamily hydrolase (TIGR01490 family)